LIISLITAPVEEEMTPILVGNDGISFLFAESNKPSSLSLFFN